MDHFNKLTPAEDERLAILIEECAEVIQAATKIQRHGYESTDPDSGETNRAALERERGDLQGAITHLVRRFEGVLAADAQAAIAALRGQVREYREQIELLQGMLVSYRREADGLRVNGQFKGPLSPDSYQQGRVAVNVDALVDRFLAWPLPASVCSDLCATKQGYPHRSGTNLLSAVEAKAMIEHVLGIAQQAHGGVGDANIKMS